MAVVPFCPRVARTCKVTSREVPRGEKMLCSGTDPKSYITECTFLYEDYLIASNVIHEQDLPRNPQPLPPSNPRPWSRV